MADIPACTEVRDILPELAMGVASGDVRARALVHLAGCDDCSQELEHAADIADELLLLAPEHEPPTGFDVKVLAAVGRQWPRRTTMLLSAAALTFAAGVPAGLTWWQGADDREVAAQYRDTLAVADGRDLRAADLTGASGAEVGNAFAYQGEPSWLFLAVENGYTGEHRVRLVTTDGRSQVIGVCRVRNGQSTWGTTIDVPVAEMDHIELERDGRTTMTARFR